MRCNDKRVDAPAWRPSRTLTVVDGELADDEVVELLDRARADDAARARARRRWLQRQAAEGATLLGTLVDLAEAAATVVVATTAGRRWTGRVLAVVDDAVVLATPGARLVIATSAVSWVRVPDGAPADGCRRPVAGTTMIDLLAGAADERADVVLHAAGAEAVRGRLVAVGDDVLTVRVEGGGAVYVAAASVSEAAVLASG
jgi:hypothetical protein